MSSISDEMIVEHVNAPKYVPSLPVPNVQELVKLNPLQVPDRYVRGEDHKPISSDMSWLSSNVPIVDLSLLSKGDKKELSKLDAACKEWGFFQVVNHGIAKEVLQKMKDCTGEFFELPLEEKNKYATDPDDIHGYGHAYVASEDQTLDWSDALMLILYPIHYRKLRFWPRTPKGYKGSIEDYAKGIRDVAVELLQSISTIMGMDKEALLGLHQVLVQGMRINYYPKCSRPEEVLGISPHSDTSTITILMEGNGEHGLQIKHNDEWVLVKTLPDALVVNVGDVIEILSNGKYRSIEHRAVTNKDKVRISYAIFLGPNDDVEIEPLDHLVGSQDSQKYKKVVYGEYVRSSMRRKMEGKVHTQMAKIET